MSIKVALTPADIERRVAASHASPERLAQFAARMRMKAELAESRARNFLADGQGSRSFLQDRSSIRRRTAANAASDIRDSQVFSEITPQHLDALRKAKLRENVADIDRKALAQVIQEQAGLKQKIRAAKGEADGIMQQVAKDPVPTPAPLPAPAPAPKGYGAGHLAAGVAGGVGLGLVGGMLGAKALGKKRETEGV